jgi:hypothetical protein
MRRAILNGLAALALLAACCVPAWALGMETFGNAPMIEGNFNEWPGVMPVVNHPSRVYHTWVNGNDESFFQGDTATVNALIQHLAEVKTAAREVVLRPGPGTRKTFDQKREVGFTAHLQLLGGIANHLVTRDQGAKVWSPHPVLTVYTGGPVDVTKLQIPKGVTVLTLSEVKQRTREGLKSGDKTVRGWGAGVLAYLDPYDTESRDLIVKLLDDQDNWVRLNAAGAVTLFGKKAEPALPALRRAMAGDDKSLKERAQESIQKIETAEDRADAEREHQRQMEQINRVVAKLREG